MIKVNLVPAELLIAQRQRQQLMQAAAVGVLIFLIFLGVSFQHWNTKRRLEGELSRAEAKMKKLQAVVDQVEALEATARAVQARLNSIENLLKARFMYTEFLQDWVTTLPQGVWLQNLNTSTGENKVTITTNALARSKEDVADWVRTLETSPKFEMVELGPLNMSGASAGGRSYSFNVKCAYNYTPPPVLPKDRGK